MKVVQYRITTRSSHTERTGGDSITFTNCMTAYYSVYISLFGINIETAGTKVTNSNTRIIMK